MIFRKQQPRVLMTATDCSRKQVQLDTVDNYLYYREMLYPYETLFDYPHALID